MTKTPTILRRIWTLALTAILLCLPLVGETASSAKPDSVTEITLERIGGGPQYPGLPPDKIVLRRAALKDANETHEFDHLAQWLRASGFYSLREGHIARPFPPDMGTLTITVVEHGQARRVVSYNGQRDKELWQTEMMIRGVAAELKMPDIQMKWHH